MTFKDYIAQQLINKKLFFHCDCLFPIDATGIVRNYQVVNNEIVFEVDVEGKIVKIGENHPKLKVKEIK